MTTNRRQFLEGMSLVVPLASGLPAVSMASSAAPVSLHSVLVDGQHAQARSLGTRFAARGAAVHVVTDGEITDLWLREIQPAWRRRPVAIAGLTGSPTLFCLEQLAWTHGLRVVFHAEHVVLPSREAVHSVHVRAAALAPLDARALASAGADWSARVADVFDSWNRNLPIAGVGPSCAGLEPALPPGASLLTSWIIAPA
jgi:hypothetical protein